MMRLVMTSSRPAVAIVPRQAPDACVLLVLATGAAGAQQQQQPRPQPPLGCFTDEPQHARQPSGLNSARPLHRQDVAHRRLCISMGGLALRGHQRAWVPPFEGSALRI